MIGTSELAERAIAQIDRARFAAIADRFAHHPFAKYLDLPKWMAVNAERALLLGLGAGDRRRVLDLGAGCGYFLHICRLLGHDVVGIDVAEPLYQAITELLDLQVLEHRIDARRALPVPPPYDVVTAHMVCFNGHNTAGLWGTREWSWFLDQFVGATVHLELNKERDGTLFPRGVAELFGDAGAIITGHHVVFPRVRAARP